MRSWVPSYTSTPLSKHRLNQSGPDQNCVFPRMESFYSEAKIETDEQGTDRYPGSEPTKSASCDLSLLTSTTPFQSPRKRKVSQPKLSCPSLSGHFALDKLEHRDLEIDYKRRKFGLAQQALDTCTSEHLIYDPVSSIGRFPPDDTASLHSKTTGSTRDDPVQLHFNNFFTGHMGEAQKLPTSPFERRAYVNPRPPFQSRKPIAAKLKANLKNTLFSWRKGECSNDTRRATEDKTESGSSSIFVPLPNTIPTATTGLSQEQIQHNYKEFEEQAKRKAAEKEYYTATVPGFDGVLSPTSEVDKDFERAFLEDSEVEDWMSEVDDLSENLGIVKMEG